MSEPPMKHGQGTSEPQGHGARDKRQERLKQALRENLKRRKSQARERADVMPSSAASDHVAGDASDEGPGK
jgi:hypothetical protein